jgi:hypothetical protein
MIQRLLVVWTPGSRTLASFSILTPSGVGVDVPDGVAVGSGVAGVEVAVGEGVRVGVGVETGVGVGGTGVLVGGGVNVPVGVGVNVGVGGTGVGVGV